MTENIRDTWRTPQWLFDYVNNRWGPLDSDAAANKDNAKCLHYWTRDNDALSMGWYGMRIFCNPPFGRGNDLLAWLRKGAEADLAVFVLPARTDTEWFTYAVDNAAEIVCLGGRVNFVPPKGVKQSSNRERTLLVVFRGIDSPGASVSTTHVKEIKNAT